MEGRLGLIWGLIQFFGLYFCPLFFSFYLVIREIILRVYHRGNELQQKSANKNIYAGLILFLFNSGIFFMMIMLGRLEGEPQTYLGLGCCNNNLKSCGAIN